MLTPVKPKIVFCNLADDVASPSVSSPISSSSALAPLRRKAMVLIPFATEDGSCTIVLPAVIRAIDLSRELFAVTKALPLLSRASPMPAEVIENSLPILSNLSITFIESCAEIWKALRTEVKCSVLSAISKNPTLE